MHSHHLNARGCSEGSSGFWSSSRFDFYSHQCRKYKLILRTNHVIIQETLAFGNMTHLLQCERCGSFAVAFRSRVFEIRSWSSSQGIEFATSRFPTLFLPPSPPPLQTHFGCRFFKARRRVLCFLSEVRERKRSCYLRVFVRCIHFFFLQIQCLVQRDSRISIEDLTFAHYLIGLIHTLWLF